MPFARGPSRVVWWGICPGEEDRVTVSAFEGTIGPLSYAAGYGIFALAALLSSSLVASLTAALLVLVGAIGLSSLCSDKPISSSGSNTRFQTLRTRHLLAVLGVTFAGFFLHGVIQVALLTEFSGATVGLLLCLLLLFTACYGLYAGSRPSTSRPERAQLLAVIGLSGGLLLLILGSPWNPLLIGALLLIGLLRAPVFIYSYHLSASYVAAPNRTEAIAWNGSSIWLGMAGGKLVGGFAAEHGLALTLASALPVLGLALCCALWLLRGARGEQRRAAVREADKVRV